MSSPSKCAGTVTMCSLNAGMQNQSRVCGMMPHTGRNETILRDMLLRRCMEIAAGSRCSSGFRDKHETLSILLSLVQSAVAEEEIATENYSGGHAHSVLDSPTLNDATVAAAAARRVDLRRYKTELCRSFAETGRCRYGVKCQFAHGPDELRPMARHPRYRTELCKSFHDNGFCPYGSRCNFIHGELDGMVGSASPPCVPLLPEGRQLHGPIPMSPPASPPSVAPLDSIYVAKLTSYLKSMQLSKPTTKLSIDEVPRIAVFQGIPSQTSNQLRAVELHAPIQLPMGYEESVACLASGQDCIKFAPLYEHSIFGILQQQQL